MFHPLHSCLHPRTVALIGLTDNPSGLQPLRALLAVPFSGTLLPIHATQSSLLGLPTYPDLNVFSDPPDLVIVSLAGFPTSDGLVNVLRRCIERGSRAIFLHSPPHPLATFQPLIDQVADSLGTRPDGVRFFGPSEGFSNPITGCHLLDGPAPKAGRVGLLAPTAAWLGRVIHAAHGTSVGFSTCVAVGMETDVGYHDYLGFFSEDDQTHVIILMYQQCKQSQQVLQALHQVALNKPVLLYPIPAPVAADANSSDNLQRLIRGLFHQAGALIVESLDHLIQVAETLLHQPFANGSRVAILADQPESAALAQTVLLTHQLSLADWSATTQAQLVRRIPTAASNRPVVVDAPVTLADSAMALLADDAVDALLVVSRLGHRTLQGSPEEALLERQTAARLARLAREADKPVVIQSDYQPLRPPPLRLLHQRGVSLHHTVEQAVIHLASLVKAGRAQQRVRATLTDDLLDVTSPTWDTVRVTPGGRGSLLESEARELLKAHGILVPPHFMARRPADLGRAARQFGDQPVVMKIVSRDILRKSEAGCVLLNVQGEAEMGKAYGVLIKKALAYAPRADIRGVLVTPMAPPGIELAIGMTRHTPFGPVMRLELNDRGLDSSPNRPPAGPPSLLPPAGGGGRGVSEAFRSLPLHSVDAEDVLATLREGALLKATPPIDRTALVQLLILLSRLCLGHPEIAELELSPVFAHADGYTIADACMILAEDQTRSTQPLKGSPDTAAADAPTVVR